MLNKKSTKFFLIIIFVILFVSILLINITDIIMDDTNNTHTELKLYFYNPTTKKLQYEKRKIKKDEEIKMTQDLLAEFWSGPKKSGLSKTKPTEIQLLDSNIDSEGTYNLIFDNNYKTLEPSTEVIFRTSLVWTLTELDFIKNINIFVGHEELLAANKLPIKNLNRANTLINKVIEAGKIETQLATLYFPDSKNNFLISEQRMIKREANQHFGKYVVEELLKGPNENPDAKKIFSEGVKSIKFETDGGTVCIIDFNKEFLNAISQNENIEKLQIYSFVNTLTLISPLKKVQFLVEGKKIQEISSFVYKGKLDLSKTFEADESLNLKP